MPSESQLGGRFAPVRTLADFLAATGLCFDDGDSSGPGGAASSLVASRPGEPSMIWGRHFSSFRTVPALSGGLLDGRGHASTHTQGRFWSQPVPVRGSRGWTKDFPGRERSRGKQRLTAEQEAWPWNTSSP
jgi:hypothetical protein